MVAELELGVSRRVCVLWVMADDGEEGSVGSEVLRLDAAMVCCGRL